MSAAVSDDIAVGAAPAEVLAVINDVAAYPEWQSEIRSAEVIEADGQGRPVRARFTVDAKIMTASYTLAYTHGDHRVAWELVEADQLDELTGSYTLAARADGGTDVTYELSVRPSIPVPGLLRRQAARRIADGALKGLRRRVESGG